MQTAMTTATVQVDENERILLPQAVREQMQIEPGTTLLIETSSDGEIRLRIAPQRPAILDKGGLLVITSEAPGIEDAVERDREDRIASFLTGFPR